MLEPNCDPTPAEIAAECLRFQAGWSDEERLSRLSGRDYRFSQANYAAIERDASEALEKRLSAIQPVKPAESIPGPVMARTGSWALEPFVWD